MTYETSLDPPDVPVGHFSVLTEMTLTLIAPLGSLATPYPNAFSPTFQSAACSRAGSERSMALSRTNSPLMCMSSRTSGVLFRRERIPSPCLAPFRYHSGDLASSEGSGVLQGARPGGPCILASAASTSEEGGVNNAGRVRCPAANIPPYFVVLGTDGQELVASIQMPTMFTNGMNASNIHQPE